MAIRIAPTSGSTTSPSPVCTIRSMPATGSAPRSSLSSSAATRSAVIRSSCGAISTSAATTLGATANPSCETNRAARSIRNGSSPNDISGAAGVSSILGAHRRQTVQRIAEFAGTVGGDADRHGVRGEIAAYEIVLEALAEAHLRVARHLVVGVGAERGDLHAIVALADPDRAVLDAGVPERVGPSAQHRLYLLGPGVGGEIEVGTQPAQQRVAHTAADEVELVAGVSEHATQFAQHAVMPVQRDLRGRQQFGVRS